MEKKKSGPESPHDRNIVLKGQVANAIEWNRMIIVPDSVRSAEYRYE
jgi:hypothetical protein